MAAIFPVQSGDFHLFAKLPREIRLMIWELALPGPRIIGVTQKPLKKNVGDWEREFGIANADNEYVGAGLLQFADFGGMFWQSRYGGLQDRANFNASTKLVGVKSPTPAPDILFVCKDAYAVASQRYKRAFSSIGSFPETYFDFEIDTLYITEEDFLQQLSASSLPDLETYRIWPLQSANDLARVQNLAILLEPQEDQVLNDDSLERWTVDILRHFRNLKKLTLVFDQYIHAEDDGSILHLEEPTPVDEILQLLDKYNPDPQDYADSQDENPRDKAEFLMGLKRHPDEQKVNMSVLQQIHAHKVEKVEPYLRWQLPAIEYAVILADTYWSDLHIALESAGIKVIK